MVRNILAGVGAVVVVGIAISAVSSHGNGVSTTPSGSTSGTASTSSSSATAQAVARIGSYFDVRDQSGDTYWVTLVKIVDPAESTNQIFTPDSGTRFVGAVFKVKALSGSPQDEDANDAAVIGSNEQSYSANIADIAGYTNFDNGMIHVAQGETVTGSVTFQVPSGLRSQRSSGRPRPGSVRRRNGTYVGDHHEPDGTAHPQRH